MRPALPAAAALALLSASLWSAADALALDCRDKAQEELSRLALGADAISSLRYVEKHNPTDRGPDVLGVRAWVRLKSCSGYLVIDMTRSCFVRQSYTRGDCRVEKVTAY
jgi:hypothetical protein